MVGKKQERKEGRRELRCGCIIERIQKRSGACVWVVREPRCGTHTIKDEQLEYEEVQYFL